MQVTMLMLVGMAVATFVGVQVYERFVLPRSTKHRRDGGKP
jgi:hypothetical protein